MKKSIKMIINIYTDTKEKIYNYESRPLMTFKSINY